MKSLFCAILLLSLGFQNSVHAIEPTSDLSEELAIRLIGEMLQIRPGGIRVATVIEGAKRSEDGFEERQMRRVTAVHPVLQEGRMVRRVRCYDFSWSPRYGWFYQETCSGRGGEEVRIWSERVGAVVVK